MSSGEDSETAEWEREQMLRGTQSRRQKCHQPKSADKSGSSSGGGDIIDATVAKRHVNQDIERVEGAISVIKKNMGSIRLDIAKSEKRLDGIKKHIEKLEARDMELRAQAATLAATGNMSENPAKRDESPAV